MNSVSEHPVVLPDFSSRLIQPHGHLMWRIYLFSRPMLSLPCLKEGEACPATIWPDWPIMRVYWDVASVTLYFRIPYGVATSSTVLVKSHVPPCKNQTLSLSLLGWASSGVSSCISPMFQELQRAVLCAAPWSMYMTKPGFLLIIKMLTPLGRWTCRS